MRSSVDLSPSDYLPLWPGAIRNVRLYDLKPSGVAFEIRDTVRPDKFRVASPVGRARDREKQGPALEVLRAGE